MSTIILCDNSSPDSVAYLCKQYNFGIEIQSFHNPEKISSNATEEHLQAIDHIMPRFLHGPFGDLNPGSHDSLIRDTTLKRLNFGYQIAQKLNINNIVFHNGYVPGTRPLVRWLPQSIKFWKEFIKNKEETNFYIENMLENDPEVLGNLIDGIELKNIHVCLDIGHVHCHSKYKIIEWIKRLGNKIKYVHLHDNHGLEDEHLELGGGTIPLREVFDNLKMHCPEAVWGLEAKKEGIKKSIKWLKKNKYLSV